MSYDTKVVAWEDILKKYPKDANVGFWKVKTLTEARELFTLIKASGRRPYAAANLKDGFDLDSLVYTIFTDD